jgi:subtilisin family serine protease
MDAKSGPTIEAQSLPTGIDRINAELSARDGTGIEVAVIDTGIDTSHPDLKANILGGKNCSTGKPTAYQDGNGHGTHVAGTIAAIKNTVGVVGVAPAAKLWAVRVLDNSGNGSWSSVICGIDFVTSQASHIKVANMSLGGTGTSDVCGLSTTSALHAAICRSVAAGVTYVVAAGNENDDVKNHVPAAYPEVIAVSALADSYGKSCGAGSATSYGADDTFASFSNYATLATDLARIIGAPGVNIYSTWKGGGYNTISGTSMATPHVAGAAALYLQTHPTATPTQVKTALLAAGEAKDTNVNGECATGIFSHVSSTKHPEAVLRTEGL